MWILDFHVIQLAPSVTPSDSESICTYMYINISCVKTFKTFQLKVKLKGCCKTFHSAWNEEKSKNDIENSISTIFWTLKGGNLFLTSDWRFGANCEFRPPGGQNVILTASMSANICSTSHMLTCGREETETYLLLQQRQRTVSIDFELCMCPADEWKSNNHLPPGFSRSPPPPEGNNCRH